MTPRAISTLVLWQWLTVFIGVVLTGLFLRFYYTDWPNEPPNLPAYPRFIRNYGFWLCGVPVGWAIASILSVGSLDALPQISRRYTVAGYVLWTVLVVILFFSVGIACEDHLGYINEEQELDRTHSQPSP